MILYILPKGEGIMVLFNVIFEMVYPKIMYRSMTSDVNGGTSRVVKKAEERYRGFVISPKRRTHSRYLF
jgi:hypothetical protein